MAKKKTKTDNQTPRLDALQSAWDKFRPFIPEDELPEMEAALERPLPPAIRINPLKMQTEEIGPLAQKYGWVVEAVPFCADGFRLRNAETLPGHTIEHKMGQVYIQDSASMLPVSLFDKELMDSSPLILDLAASPGGKTTHLISRSMDKGLIIANDSSASRITALKKVMNNWGGVRQAIVNFAGESFGDWFPDRFDVVLLDAPCSMQSLVSLDSHPMRPITEREEEALAQRQTALLKSALCALRPGGQVVYSTCTLSPFEDEAVVDAMIKRFGNKISVEDAGLRLPFPAPGLSGVNGQQFDPSLTGTVRLWPHRYETAGFYSALISKLEPFGRTSSEAPVRSFSKSSFVDLKSSDKAEIRKYCSDELALDLDDLLADTGCDLWRREKEVWILPDRFVEEFGTLPSKSIGRRMLAENTDGFIPDNEFVSRFYNRIDGHKWRVPPEFLERWMHGEDLSVSGSAPAAKGRLILAEDEAGLFIGCGRMTVGRIRNFLK